MSKLRYILPALLLPAVVGSAIAIDGADADKAAPLACDIRISETPAGLEVEPLAIATAVLSGDYQFTVSKKSPGGTSVSSQSGDFETTAGAPTSLGLAVVDREGSLKAELTIHYPGGAVSCERLYPEA